MAVGLRFGLGPLVAYIPLTGRRKRRGPGVTGRTVAAGVKGLAWLYAGAFIIAFFILAWPYLLMRWVGDRQGWPKGRSVLYGVAAAAAWIACASLAGAITS